MKSQIMSVTESRLDSKESNASRDLLVNLCSAITRTKLLKLIINLKAFCRRPLQVWKLGKYQIPIRTTVSKYSTYTTIQRFLLKPNFFFYLCQSSAKVELRIEKDVDSSMVQIMEQVRISQNFSAYLKKWKKRCGVCKNVINQQYLLYNFCGP